MVEGIVGEAMVEGGLLMERGRKYFEEIEVENVWNFVGYLVDFLNFVRIKYWN
jgi:hypothetical protein